MAEKDTWTRREFLATTAVGTAALAIGCGGGASGTHVDGGGALDGALGDALRQCEAPTGPTPPCAETADNVLGPAYLTGAPFRADLNVLDWPGTPLIMAGRVVGPDCETPLPDAVIEVWQAADDGHYDGGAIDPDGDPAPSPE